MVEESKESKSLPSEQQNIWLCSYDHLIGNNAFDAKYNIKSIQTEWMQIDNFGLSISNTQNTHLILSRKPVLRSIGQCVPICKINTDILRH